VSLAPFPLNLTGVAQRVVLVALCAPAMLLLVAATVPALIVLPFRKDGIDRAAKILAAHTTYARVVLASSRTAATRS
jgi:hypothetical protein